MKGIKIPKEYDRQLFEKLSELVQRSSFIDPELYIKYEVKRGLRDIEGRGVLAGLTRIGEVHSYIIDESEHVPVPGRLIYRGIDITELVIVCKDNRFGFEEVCYLLLFKSYQQNELKNFEELLVA